MKSTALIFLASTLLTGFSAFAGDNDHFEDASVLVEPTVSAADNHLAAPYNETMNEPVDTQKVIYKTPAEFSFDEPVLGGRK